MGLRNQDLNAMPKGIPKNRLTVADIIYGDILERERSSCWLLYPVNNSGYASASYNGKLYMAHHLAILFEKGEFKLEEGEEVDHLCSIRNCYNVEHLEIVSIRENRFRSGNQHTKKTVCPKCSNPYTRQDRFGR